MIYGNHIKNNVPYLDTSSYKEINQNRFHFGLTTLEVIATNQGVVLDGKINKP